MNFMKTVQSLNKNTITVPLLQLILKTLQSRLNWLEMREPDSTGVVYETWEEKFGELEECISIVEDAIRHLEETNLSQEDLLSLYDELSEEVVETIELYNVMWGGLTRLKIE